MPLSGHQGHPSCGKTLLLRDEAETNPATVPWTWATGDIIEITGPYESA